MENCISKTEQARRIGISPTTAKRYIRAETVANGQFTETVTILIELGLLIAGFVVHPVGEISNSVLVVYGETFTLASAILGMDYHYRYRM